jgi:predicted short-subunit dehydrogenase-like oxidoreductase (DUF2520 family)
VDIRDLGISLAAPGRAARAFARSWLSGGGRIKDVIARSLPKAEQAAEAIGSGRARLAGAGRFDCDLLIVGVTDDSIRSFAEQLSRHISCRFAFHLSGALPAEELSSLRPAGAAVGSLHAVRAFTGAAQENWSGAFVALEGDEEAVRIGRQVVAAIGARGRPVATRDKPLYHAAATLAAGGAVALVSMATQAWTSLGIPEEESRRALAELSSGAVATFAQGSLQDAFTGPIARRDLGTVRAHRAALAGRPEILAVYAALARETLRRTPDRGKEEEILALLV